MVETDGHQRRPHDWLTLIKALCFCLTTLGCMEIHNHSFRAHPL